MLFIVLRYLAATPFLALWAICLLGNLWMLMTTLLPGVRREPAEPVPGIGGLCGLVALVLLPGLWPWWKELALALSPEAVGAALALFNAMIWRTRQMR